MQSSIKHVYLVAYLTTNVVIRWKHLRHCLLPCLLLFGSQHQSRLRSHSQVLRVPEVLRIVLVDIMRQLSTENQQRSCSLVALLHILHQLR